MIKRYKKPTVLVTWAFAYLAIFMVPVVLLSYVLLRSTKVITNESIRANENFAEQISISLDKGLSDLSNVAQNCVRSYEVLQILESQEYGTAQFHYNAYIAIEYMRSIAVIASNVEDVYIFLSDGSVMSLTSYYPITYVDSIMSYIDFPYTQYLDKADEFQEDQFTVISQDGEQYICYICVPSTYSLSQLYGQIVVVANLDSLAATLAQSHEGANSRVVVLDENDQLVFSNMELSKETLKAFLNSEKSGEFQFQDERGEWQGFAVADSAVSSLRYVVITPRGDFLKSYFLVQKLSLICVLLAIVLFCLLAVVLLRRNYAPLRALQTSVVGEKEQDTPLFYRNNEWQEIRQAVDRTLDENRRYSQEIKQQRQMIQQNILMSLLRGRIHSTDGLTSQEYCASYGIIMPHSNYLVLLLSIPSMVADPISVYSFQYNLVREAVTQKFAERWLYYITDTGGGLVVILNFDQDGDSVKMELRHLLNEIYSLLNDEEQISFYTAVSSVCSSFEGISKAYYEASYVMDYLQLHQKKMALFYSDYLSETAGRLYPYDSNMEQRLNYYLQLGMEDRALRQLDLIFDQIGADNSNLPELVNCLVYDVTGTLLKQMEPPERQQASNLIRELRNAVSLETKKEILRREIGKLCNYNTAQLEQKIPKAVEAAIDYIRQNYNDSELNVNSLADNLHISSSYLSKLFIEQTGQRLLDFINQTRIQQAKVLLQQNVVVQEVASLVGLRTSANLIRLFKKYEGVTPGEYREMYHNKNT